MVSDLKVATRVLFRKMSDVPKRKRRTKQEIAAAAAAAAAASATTSSIDGGNTSPSEPVVPKSRGKKKVQPVVAFVTSEGIQGSFETFNKGPLIAHLDIRSADVVFYDQPFHYNPDTSDLLIEPQPYDSTNQDLFSISAESLEKDVSVVETVVTPDNTVKNTAVTSVPTVAPVPANNRREYGSNELLVSFGTSRQTQSIPERTDVCCFWCSHPFEGRPCILPQACEGGVWKVYGNFCTPSCGLSYLLNQTMDTHIRWERIALLNRLYSSSIGGGIYPAPSRETLTAFGGTFSISEYRGIIEGRRVRVDIHVPPMVSILASMDTKPIDFYETSIKNTFISGAVADRFARAEEGLKLRRTKPLKDRESTLDSCLNISIRQPGGF